MSVKDDGYVVYIYKDGGKLNFWGSWGGYVGVAPENSHIAKFAKCYESKTEAQKQASSLTKKTGFEHKVISFNNSDLLEKTI